jgi:dephospho-CoA kinase
MYIGISGKIGSGKTAVANYLNKKYGFKILRFRDIILEVREQRKLGNNRENMQRIGNELYQCLGPKLFSQLLLYNAEENFKYAIDSIRHLGIDKFFREEFGSRYLLFFIEAKNEVRIKRLSFRDKKTFNLSTLSKLDDHSVEQETEKFKKCAEYVIPNNETVEILYKQIDDIMKQILQ